MKTMLTAAKAAKFSVTALTTEQKNAALEAMASALLDNQDAILAANAMDIENATGKVPQVMLDRLLLTPDRIAGMAKGIREVAALPDPVGHLLERHTRADGLQIDKISVPMGVIAIIYESRPNVTSDAAALALKAGSVCILRGGKEAFASANAIVNALKSGLRSVGVTEDAVNLVQDTSRASATVLMTANGYVDLLIPRGGAGLINACVQNATVPCIATGTGICHVYVEATADQEMALAIIENAKTSRPSVCNAEEVLLVDKAIAAEFLPKLAERIGGRVEFRLDGNAASIISGTPAGEKDFDTEFLDYILAVKCVENYAEAVAHIAAHSTGHSEAIVTNSDAAKAAFVSGVDSSAVYINASTRFTDGGEFGLGCEMGISTQKLHARGPMGLKELTTYKYVITGNGHIR
ncbi:MAG: glutamate-5-semialdehyde dehydrogenase [Oscillospiraceae bacterium]|nr:glutamate-5-semialdehyde dehydrogenase [Oscillospiraceae bacterium]